MSTKNTATFETEKDAFSHQPAAAWAFVVSFTSHRHKPIDVFIIMTRQSHPISHTVAACSPLTSCLFFCCSLSLSLPLLPLSRALSPLLPFRLQQSLLSLLSFSQQPLQVQNLPLVGGCSAPHLLLQRCQPGGRLLAVHLHTHMQRHDVECCYEGSFP